MRVVAYPTLALFALNSLTGLFPHASATSAPRGVAPAIAPPVVVPSTRESRDSIPAGGSDGWGGVCWDASLGGAVRSTPAVTAHTVFVGNNDGFLYALDRRTGAVRWRFDAKSPVDASPDVRGGVVYVTARSGTLFAVGAANGVLHWRRSPGAAVPLKPPQGEMNYTIASPTVADSMLYVGAKDGVVYALDAGRGGVRWKTSLATSVWTRPAVTSSTVYVAANDGKLYALDRGTGARRWAFVTDGATMDLEKEGYDRRSIQSAPTVANGTVYFGSRDGNIYAVDALTGAARWKTSYAPSWISGSPTLRNDTAFVTTSDAKLVAALDARTGRELWHTSLGARVFPAVSLIGASAVVGTDGGALIALDAATGTRRWGFEIGDPMQASASVRDGSMYVGTDGGHVIAIANAPGPYPALGVFWDPALDHDPVPGGLVLRDYLEARGYAVLTARGLATFMSARLADHRPSVVVFAQDLVPRTVAPTYADTVLFRRYLDAGGKIVWFGNPPFAMERDSVGRIARDTAYGYPLDFSLARTAKVLGSVFSSLGVAAWPSQPTARGRAWGLSSWSVPGIAVDTADVSEVLALTETKQAGAWVRSYGGRSGTGLVFLAGGGIPQQDPIPIDQLAAIQRVAEYGVLSHTSACSRGMGD